jgi:hypothetical protein
MKFCFLLFFSFLLTSNNESKEIIIGNPKSYNLKVIVETDPKKKTDEISFSHIIKESIYFRLKTQILATEIIDVEKLDGYVLSGINELKSKKHNIYQMEYYRSNGSPEIFIYYDTSGKRLCKMTAYRDKTEYNFIAKGLNDKYFTDYKLIKSYDIDLF